MNGKVPGIVVKAWPSVNAIDGNAHTHTIPNAISFMYEKYYFSFVSPSETLLAALVRSKDGQRW